MMNRGMERLAGPEIRGCGSDVSTAVRRIREKLLQEQPMRRDYQRITDALRKKSQDATPLTFDLTSYTLSPDVSRLP